jgi:hypothetical protein
MELLERWRLRQSVDQAITRALFDPEYAATLLRNPGHTLDFDALGTRPIDSIRELAHHTLRILSTPTSSSG